MHIGKCRRCWRSFAADRSLVAPHGLSLVQRCTLELQLTDAAVTRAQVRHALAPALRAAGFTVERTSGSLPLLDQTLTGMVNGTFVWGWRDRRYLATGTSRRITAKLPGASECSRAAGVLPDECPVRLEIVATERQRTVQCEGCGTDMHQLCVARIVATNRNTPCSCPLDMCTCNMLPRCPVCRAPFPRELTGRRGCGTPGCTLPDWHAGPHANQPVVRCTRAETRSSLHSGTS